MQTAPSGNISNTIVKAGKTTKLIFFMLCTSFANFDLPFCLEALIRPMLSSNQKYTFPAAFSDMP